MDNIVNENTPLVVSNSLPYPATPTRKKTLPSFNPSPTSGSSQFSAPRRWKTAGLAHQAELSTSDMTLKWWPRIGKRIPSEDIKVAIQQIFGYEPRSWQLTLAEKVLEGHHGCYWIGGNRGREISGVCNIGCCCQVVWVSRPCSSGLPFKIAREWSGQWLSP